MKGTGHSIGLCFDFSLTGPDIFYGSANIAARKFDFLVTTNELSQSDPLMHNIFKMRDISCCEMVENSAHVYEASYS